MRKLETEQLILYYPDGSRSQALEVAARLEYCRSEVRKLARVKDGPAADKSRFVLPRLPFNNAYVAPALAGMEQVAVVPTYNTIDYFMLFGIAPDPGNIGCHEMVHDQSFSQVSGLAAAVRALFGAAYSPQIGLDSWWQEGLAVYYETRLQGTGRLWTPYFEGLFAAGLQAVPSLHGGWLNVRKRGITAGGNYLFGAFFVDYLARAHGEAELWRVVDNQSNSLFFPFAISKEFDAVYDESLASLLEDFEADSRRRFPARQRPAGQRTLQRLGQDANLVHGAGGAQVLLTQGVDDPPRLLARDARGGERSLRLTDIGVGRRLIAPDVELTSGLTLTGDGAQAYFVALDVGPVFSESRLMRLDVASGALDVLWDDLDGSGGSISADGSAYYYTRTVAGSAALGSVVYRLDLARGEAVQLTRGRERRYQLNPMISPDGRRLLVTEASDSGVRLALYDAASGRRLRDVAAPPGHALQGSWVDDDRLVFAGVAAGRLQVFEADLRNGGYRQLTDVPYLASRPFSDGKVVRFLNRDGWDWTLDEVDLPPPLEPTRMNASTPASAVVASPAGALPSPPSHGRPSPAAAAAVAPESYALSQRAPIAERPPRVIEDEPYSLFDGLFLPQAWAPWISQREEGYVAFGLTATGGDHLGKQRWALGAAWDFAAQLPSGSISYVNAMASPLFVQLDAAFVGRREETLDDFAINPAEAVDVREIVGSLVLGASWYDSVDASIGARYSDARYELASGGAVYDQLRFAGPVASVGFSSAERTPYAGRRLALAADATGTYFPNAISSVDYELADVLGRLEVVSPLPLSRRHTLTLSGRVRDLLGAPPGQNLLQVGGTGTDVLPALQPTSPTDDNSAGVLPPGVRFFEALRGFEDLTLFARRAAIGEATYTYPFIIDWGTLSTLRILPALFVRQLSLDLFFSAASLLEDNREAALATGAALRLGIGLWNIPLSVDFQLARRLTYDEELAPYFTLGADLQ